MSRSSNMWYKFCGEKQMCKNKCIQLNSFPVESIQCKASLFIRQGSLSEIQNTTLHWGTTVSLQPYLVCIGVSYILGSVGVKIWVNNNLTSAVVTVLSASHILSPSWSSWTESLINLILQFVTLTSYGPCQFHYSLFCWVFGEQWLIFSR